VTVVMSASFVDAHGRLQRNRILTVLSLLA
jgi:hypothetical protein